MSRKEREEERDRQTQAAAKIGALMQANVPAFVIDPRMTGSHFTGPFDGWMWQRKKVTALSEDEFGQLALWLRTDTGKVLVSDKVREQLAMYAKQKFMPAPPATPSPAKEETYNPYREGCEDTLTTVGDFIGMIGKLDRETGIITFRITAESYRELFGKEFKGEEVEREKK
jgi:hypothetical protein